MYRRSWLLLVGLAALMLACGVSSVVLEEPTASPEPTEAPPTATPVPPTDTPPPTEIPTSPPPADLLTSEATGACQHPFYPVRSDTVWKYQTQVGDAAPTGYSVTYDGIGADAFTSIQTHPASTDETVWLCTDEGLIPTEITSFMFLQIPGFEFETLGYSGAMLPPPDAWVEGATWATNYTLQATTKVLGLSISSQVDISVDNQISGVERVVVPAGAYPQAVRIDSSGTALINAPGTQSEYPFGFSHWYVEGVGLVKILANVQGTAFDMQLTSIEQQ